MRVISGTTGSASGRASLEVPRMHQVAAYMALAWAAVLLCWASYSCFWQVGIADFAKGIVYYGLSDGSGRADTANLNWAVVYIIAGLLILRANSWARGLACGAALIEGYNRLRSLTGALFDSRQQGWFLDTTEGNLKLATFSAGVLITTTLVFLLIKEAAVYEPWVPPTNRWTQQAQEAQLAHQAQQAQQLQPQAQQFPPQGQQVPPQGPYGSPPPQGNYGYPQQGHYGYPQQGQQAPPSPQAPQAPQAPGQFPNPYQNPQQPAAPYPGSQPPQSPPPGN
ncbi:hypothetical protein J7E97_21490 [Streptomyces sp. ISL-66]|uniref:hypothetical protein n=1 Tax=Streptomyces sp. ISL-66 TaxID=2819186 RepID=UPI001BE9CC75|nr:hypothetical protein [Streptomyces sp. ISL-66]MBT2470374.1 hypothetical protein [Streptomyces sp. ISL-66]